MGGGHRQPGIRLLSAGKRTGYLCQLRAARRHHIDDHHDQHYTSAGPHACADADCRAPNQHYDDSHDFNHHDFNHHHIDHDAQAYLDHNDDDHDYDAEAYLDHYDHDADNDDFASHPRHSPAGIARPGRSATDMSTARILPIRFPPRPLIPFLPMNGVLSRRTTQIRSGSSGRLQRHPTSRANRAAFCSGRPIWGKRQARV